MDATENSGVKSPSQLKTVEDLCKHAEMLHSLRRDREIQWRLNLAFYRGQQYAYRVPGTARIATLPTEDGEKPRHRVRIVSNQILPGVNALQAKMLKTKPQMYATPGSGGDSDIKAAQVAEVLLENWWDDLDLMPKVSEVALWGICADYGYIKVTWDAHAGKALTFLLDPQGKPVLDESLKELFRGELDKAGIDSREFEKTVYVGDIKVEAIGPDRVLVDPAAATWEEARYAICIHDLDPDDIFVRWGVRLRPDGVPTSDTISLPFKSSQLASNPTTKRVYIGYFKPGPALPKGRYVVWSEGGDKKILADGPWEFPTNDLPLVRFSGIRVPGSIEGTSVVEHAIPLQKELNKTLSQIVEYKNLTIKPRVWAPVGSLRQRVTTEAGAVYEYMPVAGLKPEIEKLPSLPPYVFEHLQDIKARIDDIFMRTEVSEGNVPPNVEAGVAIDLLQEMATDRLAPTIMLFEKSLGKVGQLMLALAQQYYDEQRILKIKGSGGSVQVKKFTKSDIKGNISIHVEAGSGLPRTRAGREARIMALIDKGIIPPDRAWKYLDTADLKGLQSKFAQDEDMALREHDKMIQGAPINPIEARKAMQAVSQGIDPETGQPLQPGQDPQQVIQRAGLQPTIQEDMSVHLDTHAQFMKSLEYESLPPDRQQAFLTHYELTLNRYMTLPQKPQAEMPRVSLQLKSAATASEVEKILNANGIQVNEQDVLEAPRDTWVTDSVDKPDADAAGAGQEANHLSQAAATMIASDVQATTAMHDSALKHDVHTQKSSHTDALHAEQLRKAKAEADLAEKKAKESSFKPKPAAKKPAGKAK